MSTYNFSIQKELFEMVFALLDDYNITDVDVLGLKIKDLKELI